MNCAKCGGNNWDFNCATCKPEFPAFVDDEEITKFLSCVNDAIVTSQLCVDDISAMITVAADLKKSGIDVIRVLKFEIKNGE